ncbi:hypothetical protein B0T09DRAFT_349597 [Sordaria sp. MPI-SDFR-AT-0083]|nr:hypothetical protein B0T09DRAFT_349597 [Sordaria sp. MPI-SDFR-AT-0083]
MSLSVWVFWAFCGPGGPVSSFFGYVIHEQDEVRDMADVSFHFLIFFGSWWPRAVLDKLWSNNYVLHHTPWWV